MELSRELTTQDNSGHESGMEGWSLGDLVVIMGIEDVFGREVGGGRHVRHA